MTASSDFLDWLNQSDDDSSLSEQAPADPRPADQPKTKKKRQKKKKNQKIAAVADPALESKSDGPAVLADEDSSSAPEQGAKADPRPAERQPKKKKKRKQKTKKSSAPPTLEYDGPAVWAHLLANYVAPFLADRRDWNSVMASCQATFQQVKQLSSAKLPPFPTTLSLPEGSGTPTAVALSSNRKWLVVGTSTGDIQCCHVLKGWMVVKQDEAAATTAAGASDNKARQLSRRSIAQAGPIRHLAFTMSHWKEEDGEDNSSNSQQQQPLLVVGQRHKVSLWKPGAAGYEPWKEIDSCKPNDGEILTLSCHPSKPAIMTGHVCKSEVGQRALKIFWHVLDKNSAAGDGSYMRMDPGRACYGLNSRSSKGGDADDNDRIVSLGCLRAPGRLPSVAMDIDPTKYGEPREGEKADGTHTQKNHGRFCFALPGPDVRSSCLGIGTDGFTKAAFLAVKQVDDDTADGQVETIVCYGDCTSVIRTFGIGSDNERDFDKDYVDCRVNFIEHKESSSLVAPKQACLAFNHNATALAMGYSKKDKYGKHEKGIIHVWALSEPSSPLFPDLQPPSRDELLAEVFAKQVAPFIESRVDYNSAMSVNKRTHLVALETQVKKLALRMGGPASEYHHGSPPWPARIATDGYTVTALAFVGNHEMLVAGTADGQIRTFNILVGPSPPPPPVEECCDDDQVLLMEKIRAAGPIRHLAVLDRDGKRGTTALLVVQDNLETVWRGELGNFFPVYVEADATEGHFLSSSSEVLGVYSEHRRVVTCLGLGKTDQSFLFLQDRDYENGQAFVKPVIAMAGVKLQNLRPMAFQLLPLNSSSSSTPASSDGEEKEEKNENLILLAQPVPKDEKEPRLSSICAGTAPTGQIVAATLNRAGKVHYRSGKSVQDLVLFPGPDVCEWDNDDTVTVGVSAEVDEVPPATAARNSCLCFNHDCTFLAAGLDNGDGNGFVAIWNLDQLHFSDLG